MSEDRSTEILKNAILLEKRGFAFYDKVAQQAAAEPVKRFFALMAEEETRHIAILSDQFKTYQAQKRFSPSDPPSDPGFESAAAILSEDVKQQIAAADYEAAAIAAAMAMEKNAIKLYAERANEAQDPNEKSLYRWLSDWEKQHLAALSEINREITEEIWHDNSFWPF
jgi:rubrerythrin